MKGILAAGAALMLLTGCFTHTEVVSELDKLPLDTQRAVLHEIGDAQVISVLPATVAADSGYYQVDYIKNGQRKTLKVNETASVLTKSDWGYSREEIIQESAGAPAVRR